MCSVYEKIGLGKSVNWWRLCSRRANERGNPDFYSSNQKQDSILLYINEQVRFSRIQGFSKPRKPHVCIPSRAMYNEPSALEQRNAHLDTSSLCIYFLATPWEHSSSVLRNKTKARHDEWTQCSNKNSWVLKEVKILEHKRSQQSQRAIRGPKLFERLQDLNVLFLPKAERF